MSYVDDLMKEYRKLAKRADQRLVRLAGYRHDKGFEKIDQYAYKTAMKDISQYSGPSATRFNTAPPVFTDKAGKVTGINVRKLEEKIADIKKFLASPTSTKKGVQQIYKKRAEALNKSSKMLGNKGEGFTWQEWGNFWEKVGAGALDENQDYVAYAKVLYIEKSEGLTEKQLKRLKDIDFRSVDWTNEDQVTNIFGEKIGELYRSGDLDEIELERMKDLHDKGLSYKDLKTR